MKFEKLCAIILTLVMTLNLAGLSPTYVYAANAIKVDDVIANPNTTEIKNLIEKMFPDVNNVGTIKNVKMSYTGSINRQIGSFSGGKTGGILEFDKGLAFSTGNLKSDLEGSNDNGGVKSTSIGAKSQEVLDNKSLYDPCSVEFDLEVKAKGNMVIQYAFGSEEYLEYSLSNYNDKFGIIINNVNYAKVPKTNDYIAINTVNQSVNTEFFRYNTGKNSLNLPVPLNGLTKTFVASAPLQKGTNHIKIIIGDVQDASYDSVLFIKEKSIEIKDIEPGILSLNKKDEKTLVIKRVRKDGLPAIYGPVSFVLEEKSVDGDLKETVYTIPSGKSELEIPIAEKNQSEQNKISYDTGEVTIKDPKMGATIDSQKNYLKLKIGAPILTKNGSNKDGILITGLPNSKVTITKDGSTKTEYTLDATGKKQVNNLEPGKYIAIQEKDGFKSTDSNSITIIRPPYITGNFDEETITMNDTGSPKPYNISAVNAKGYRYNGTAITGGNFTVDNPLSTDTNKCGIYTLAWQAKDGEFTATKTKVIKIKPKKPEVFEGNFKHSVIKIKGLSGATASVKVGGKLYEIVKLDSNGEGIIIDPPNGTYKVTQTSNGVESDPYDSMLTINRTYTKPEISLNEYTDAPNYSEYQEGKEHGHKLTFGDSYEEKGATAKDKEDDKEANVMHAKGFNKKLTKKIKIINPMINSLKEKIKEFSMDEEGTVLNVENFVPFIGKYIVKYTVKDSDDMENSKNRLVRVYPKKLEVKQIEQSDNLDSRINIIDAVSSASVFLYNENGEPINIEDGKVKVIDKSEMYKDGLHAKVKMPTHSGNDMSQTKNDAFKGLPDGKYKILQRLYGLNSELSDVVEVKSSNTHPRITLNGLPTEIVEKGKDYSDKGVKVSDKEDEASGHQTKLETSGVDSLDTNKVGRYKVEYKATDKDGNVTTIERVVIVKPNLPEVIVGDYVNGVFKENPKGNDIKVKGEKNAIVQVVKGKNSQGALYRTVQLDGNGEGIVENLEKNVGTGYEFAAFQTIENIQSGKKYFNIEKNDTPPTIKITDSKKIIKIKKGDTLDLKSSFAEAKDNEDGDISNNIKIYKEIDKNTEKVKGTGYENIQLSSSDTNKVGNYNYYYNVKDSDGNPATAVQQVEVLPLAPQLAEVNKKIKVDGLEKGAIAKVYFIKDDGTRELYATKKVEDGKTFVEFEKVRTGKYIADQVVGILKSEYSNEISFKNPAYLRTKILDENNNPIKGVEFSVKDQDKSLKDKSHNDGTVLFGVQSAGHKYELLFKSDGNMFKVKAISSEDGNALHTETTVVGSLIENGNSIKLNEENAIIDLKKIENGKYKDTTVEKMKYKNGEFLISKLIPNNEYVLFVKYKDSSSSFVSIDKKKIKAGPNKTIKIYNDELNYGTISDEDGNPIEGAEVSVYYPKRGINGDEPDFEKGKVDLVSVPELKNGNINNSTTDNDGKYSYAVYDESEYVVVVRKQGYKTAYKVVNNVDGDLLGEDVVLKKYSSKSKGSSKDDDKIDENTEEKEGVESLEKSESTTEVNEKGTVNYQSKNSEGDDEVVKKPSKGRVFINPETGTVTYIPNKGSDGTDEFTIATRDKNGKKINITKKVQITERKKSSKKKGLAMEITPEKKEGAVGDTFKFGVDIKNNKGKNVEKATVSIKIPEGLKVPKNSKYKVKNGHIIIPVRDVKKNETKTFNFELIAKNKSDNYEIGGFVQEENVFIIEPENVALANFKVYEVGKKYIIKPYVKGMPDNNFYPEKYVTRAEVAAMLSRCLDNAGNKFRTDESPKYIDIEDSQWYSGYVEKASKYKLFKGYEDGTWKPNESITRAELAKVIANYYNISSSGGSMIKGNFKDAEGHWAEEEIYFVKKSKIAGGYEDGTYRPDNKITREEIVKLINEMLYRHVLENIKPSFYDTTNDRWSFGHIESAYRGYEYELTKDGKEIKKPLK